MQEYFDNLVKNYPWATEEALDMLNSELTEGNMTIAKVAAIIGDGSKAIQVSKAKDKSKTAEQKAKENQDKVDGIIKDAGGVMKGLMANAQPANAIAELSHEVAKIAYNTGATIGNFMGPAVGKFGKVLRGATTAGGKAIVAATGIGVVYAKLLTEQDKYARQLINYGSVVSDIDMYTTLRGSIRNLGMGFKKYADVTESALPFITASEGDVFRGQVMLAEFLEDVSTNKSFSDFGMTIQQQTQFLAQEAETLYQLGELDNMKSKSQDVLINSFEKANKLGLFLADSLGQSRMETLRQREEARTTVDFQTAILQNAQYINETLGANAIKNISAAKGYFAPLMNATMGEEFKEAFGKAVEGTVGDIQYDQSAINNIPQDFLDKLQAVGPGVAQMFVKMVEDTSTGKISSEADAVQRQREFVKLIKKQLPKLSANSEILTWANSVIAGATIVPDSFTMADIDKLTSPTFYKEQTEQADSTIDTLDNFSVTFQNIQEMLTPGFATIGNSAEFLTKNMLRFGNAVSGFFGGSDRFNEIYDEQTNRVLNETLAKVNEKNIDSSLTIAKQNIDSFEKEKTIMNDMLDEAAEMEEGADKTLQVNNIMQKIETLDKQIEVYARYLKELEDKKKTFVFREAEAKR
jgi:hypothetical protein